MWIGSTSEIHGSEIHGCPPIQPYLGMGEISGPLETRARFQTPVLDRNLGDLGAAARLALEVNPSTRVEERTTKYSRDYDLRWVLAKPLDKPGLSNDARQCNIRKNAS
jgi:hypothetical protein